MGARWVEQGPVTSNETIRFWGGGMEFGWFFFGKNGWFETGKITIFMLQTFFLTMWQWKIAGGEWEDFSYYKMIHHYVLYIYNNLGCGFNFIFIFIPTCGRWNQSDEHIFQMGWKHQLVIYYVYIYFLLWSPCLTCFLASSPRMTFMCFGPPSHRGKQPKVRFKICMSWKRAGGRATKVGG